MKVTAIKPQLRRSGHYSIFIDGVYSLSLSQAALLNSKLSPGHALNQAAYQELKQLAANDKLRERIMRRLAIRARSESEIRQFLKREKAAPAFIDQTIESLKSAGLINDEAFAESFIEQRRRLKPSSRRAIKARLRQKGVSSDIIEGLLNDQTAELKALRQVIKRQRRLKKYQDDLKLMQYLARQGFNYDDIKSAVKEY